MNKKVLNIIQKELDSKNLDLNRTFLENGGDSISAIKISNELYELGIDKSATNILTCKSLIDLIDIDADKTGSNDNINLLYKFDKILESYNLEKDYGFLEQGGDSLTAIKLSEKLNHELNINTNATDIINSKILSDLINTFDQKKLSLSSPMIERLLSSSQKNINRFLISDFFKVPKELTESEIENLIIKLIKNHPILTYSFDKKNRIFKKESNIQRLYHITKTDDLSNVVKIASKISSQIEVEKQLSEFIFITIKNDMYCYVSLHHIIGDIISLNIIKEFILNNGKKSNNFVDNKYIEWLKFLNNRSISEKSVHFWKSILNRKFDITSKKSLIRRQKVITLTKDNTKELDNYLSLVPNATLSDIYRCYVSFAIMNHFNKPEIVVMSESNGRNIQNNSDMTYSLGWYTSLYPELIKRGKDLGECITDYVKSKRYYTPDSHDYGIISQLKKEISPHDEPNINIVYLGNKNEKNSGEENLKRKLINLDIDKDNHLFFDYTFSIIRINSQLKIIIDYYDDNFDDQICNDLSDTVFKTKFKAYYPLSHMQNAMFLQSIDDENKYISQSVYKIYKNNLDIKKFKISCNYCVNNTYACNTRFFKLDNGKIVQFFDLYNNNFVEVINKSDLNDIKKFSLKQHKKGSKRINFTISQIDNSYYICITFDHSVLDGISINKLFENIIRHYKGLFVDEFNNSYIKFLEYDGLNENSYWEKKIKDEFPKSLTNPFKSINLDNSLNEFHSNNKIVKNNGFLIDGNEFNYIIEYLNKNRLTLSTLLNVSLGWVLQLLNQGSPVCYGRLVSGRQANIQNIDNGIGLFINNIPTLFDFDSNTIIIKKLREFQINNLKDLEHSNTNFSKIKSKLGIYGNFYDISFSMRKDYINENDFIFVDGTDNNEIPVAMYLGYSSRSINFNVRYNDLYVNDNLVKSFLKMLKQTILQIVYGASTFGEIEFMKFRAQGLDNTFMYDLNDRMENYLDQTAVTFNKKTIKYNDLLKLSNIYAANMLKLGISVGDRVVCYLNRGIDYVAILIAFQKIGAVLIPVDKNNPINRLKYIFFDSFAKYILTDEYLLGVDNSINILDFQNNNLDIKDISRNISPNDESYILYTSGTTGKPKGSIITYRSLSNLICKNKDILSLSRKDNVLMFASHSFDAHLLEILSSLYSGANLVIANNEERHDTNKLEKLLIDKKISFALIPPIIMDLLDFSKLKSLKTIMNAGDFVDKRVLLSIPDDLNYINGYGPSECTIWSTYFKTKKISKNLTMYSEGVPIKNTSVNILVDDVVVPPFVVGEVFLSGLNLSKGYVNRPNLNKQRFTYFKGLKKFQNRMFKTGDIGFLDDNGNLHLMGRNDDQIKINGMRVEVSEISSLLLNFKKIKYAFTTTIKRGDRKELISVIKLNDSITKDEIINSLKLYIPEYMIPQRIYVVSEFPMSVNGKVDKKSLLSMCKSSNELKFYNAEERFAKNPKLDTYYEHCLQNVLHKKENIDFSRSFLENGGNSIDAIQLFNLLKEAYPNVNIISILNCNSLNSLFLSINKTSKISDNRVNKLPKTYTYRASLMQEWFNNQIFNNSCAIFDVTSSSKSKIIESIKYVCQRQDALRSKLFYDNTGKLFIRVNSEIPPIHFFNLYKLYKNNIQECSYKFINNDSKEIWNSELFKSEKFSLKINIYKINANLYKVYLIINHALWDANSAMLFEQQVKNYLNGNKITVNIKQYKDFLDQERDTYNNIKNISNNFRDNLKEKEEIETCESNSFIELHTILNNENFKFNDIIPFIKTIAKIKNISYDKILLIQDKRKSTQFSSTLGLFLDMSILNENNDFDTSSITKDRIFLSEVANNYKELKAIANNYIILNYIDSMELEKPINYPSYFKVDSSKTNNGITVEKSNNELSIQLFSSDKLKNNIISAFKDWRNIHEAK